ncbi:MAG: hypothetical protein HZA88_23300 [Verrucomicrobia bacterium]|nr:hypothetical protein [Verrucomicrobiota bacterium]
MTTVQDLTIGASTFTLGVLVTALLQNIISRVFDRSRPSFRISDISIGPERASFKKSVMIDVITGQAIARNSILPDFDGNATTERITAYLDIARQALHQHEQVITFLSDLDRRPHLLDSALDKDNQRIKLLSEWTAYGPPIEQMAKMALENYATEVDPLYLQPHPEKWKTGPHTIITTAPGQRYALFELDENAYAEKIAREKGPQHRDRAVQEAQKTDVLRRIWIHLNEQHLRWLFRRSYHYAVSLGDDAKVVVSDLERLVQITAPDYLRVSMILTNSGGRAFAVKPFAYLRLPKADAVSGEDALIPLVMESESQSAPMPAVVKGNDALHIVMRSEMSLNSLKLLKSDGSILLDGQRLRTLYDSQVLTSCVSLSLTGFGINSFAQIVSDPHDFGLSAYARDKEALTRALRK